MNTNLQARADQLHAEWRADARRTQAEITRLIEAAEYHTECAIYYSEKAQTARDNALAAVRRIAELGATNV